MPKKNSSLVVALLLVLFLLAGCAGPVVGGDGGEAGTKTTVRVAALKGPTGMGMVKLMADNAADLTTNEYQFEFAGAPDEIVAKLTSGSVDVAAVPTNLAAVLYNKTNGNIQLLAINTLGVLYVLESGDSIHSLADLKGKTMSTTGQGATPEYALNFLLAEQGLIPGQDVTIDYLAEHGELATLMVAGKIDLAMLPEPFVTTVLEKNSAVRLALDISGEWRAAMARAGNPHVELAMGCLVVRSEFAAEHGEALSTFLDEYRRSTSFVNEDPALAAQMVAEYGIMADAALVEKAIPTCNIVCLEGEEMRRSAEFFLQVLYGANPKSVGGQLPGADFYYEG